MRKKRTLRTNAESPRIFKALSPVLLLPRQLTFKAQLGLFALANGADGRVPVRNRQGVLEADCGGRAELLTAADGNNHREDEKQPTHGKASLKELIRRFLRRSIIVKHKGILVNIQKKSF